MTASTVACVRMCTQGHIDGFHSDQRVFFDDATRLILVPRSNKVEAYDLPTGKPHKLHPSHRHASPPESGFNPHLNRKRWEVAVDSLDQFLSVQISIDAKTIAVHRSKSIIQFIDRATGNMFVQVDP